jgi:hypothetical protein
VKVNAPKNLCEYFRDTEHAARHLYAGLDSCWSYYQQAGEHWDISQVGQPMTTERRAAVDHYLHLAGQYFNLKLSEAVFAGAILQLAYTAVRLYSRNSTIPQESVALVHPSRKTRKTAVQFCIGPVRHGVQTGLIVFAARNQYNHWDEEEALQPTKAIFNALSAAFREDMWADLAFELSNPTINSYASEILLTALGWRTYNTYVAGVSAMLGEPAHP